MSSALVDVGPGMRAGLTAVKPMLSVGVVPVTFTDGRPTWTELTTMFGGSAGEAVGVREDSVGQLRGGASSGPRAAVTY